MLAQNAYMLFYVRRHPRHARAPDRALSAPAHLVAAHAHALAHTLARNGGAGKQAPQPPQLGRVASAVPNGTAAAPAAALGRKRLLADGASAAGGEAEAEGRQAKAARVGAATPFATASAAAEEQQQRRRRRAQSAM